MPLKELAPGLTGVRGKLVLNEDLASAYGNKGVDVLSSMTLMTLLEQACMEAVKDYLAADEMCVGARMEMDHLAPTPAGYTVEAKALLKEVSGSKLVFEVEAHDGADQISRGVHVRYVVSKKKFQASVEKKAALK